LIATTAKVDNFIVVTRNVKDFEPFGVSVLDPFKHTCAHEPSSDLANTHACLIEAR